MDRVVNGAYQQRVEPAQRDQGGARRSGVISRPLRRLRSCFTGQASTQSLKIYSPVTFVRFFPIGLGERCDRKTVFDPRLWR